MRKKVALISSRLPYPLTKGDRLRLYHQMWILSTEVDLYLFAVMDERPSEAELQEVSRFCKKMFLYDIPPQRSRWHMMKYFFSNRPLQVNYFFDPAVRDLMQLDIDHLRPDVIHCHLIRSMPYVEGLEHRYKVSLDFMDSMKLNDLAAQKLRAPWLRWLQSRERKNVLQFEKTVGEAVDRTWVISERDRWQLPVSLQQSTFLLSNGVDTDFFKSAPSKRPQYDLVFCGNLSYQPNIDAVHWINDHVLPQLPQMTCAIYGADQSFTIDAHPNLDIKGYVDDIRDAYHAGKIMIAPIFSGSGQQNKILEAMACARPVITTSFVNESIDAPSDEAVMLADTQSEWVQIIKRVSTDPDLAVQLGHAGRDFVIQNFSWQANTQPLLSYLRDA